MFSKNYRDFFETLANLCAEQSKFHAVCPQIWRKSEAKLMGSALCVLGSMWPGIKKQYRFVTIQNCRAPAYM